MATRTASFTFDESDRRRRNTTDVQRLQRIDRLSWLLDRSIPVGRWRIGLDPIIGLLPGIGDWIGALLSLYVLYEGARLGLPGTALTRMSGNILVETVIGAVPVVGDLFDFGWRSNTRNMALIRRHYRPGLRPRSLRWVGLTVALISFVVLVLAGVLAFAAVKGVQHLLQSTPFHAHAFW